MPKSAAVRQADNKGRILIPELAGATLIVEKIDETEYRLRKAEVVPTKALEFHEEQPTGPLSKRDALWLLSLLEKPPTPNKAAKAAARKFLKDYGRLGH